MTTFSKKIFVTVTLIVIASIGYIHGDDNNSSSCEEKPVYCCKGFIGADLLYWRAFRSGLDLVVPIEDSDTVTSEGRVISTFSGRSRDPHFSWSPGFRIRAGHELAWCHWDIAAFWSHLHSHAHGSHNSENELRWNIDFDVIDLIARYEFCFNSCFTVRPFGGLRGARIDQKLHLSEFFENDLITITQNNKEKFSGIGPIFGLEANWGVGCNFSLFTNLSVSWLYGHFNVRIIETEEFVDAVNFIQLRNHLDANLAVADAAIGVRWQKCYCKNKLLFLQLSLEHHRYFNYNRIGEYSDLSFDGVNFSAGIEY